MAAFQLSVAYSPYNCGDKRQIRVQIRCVGTYNFDNYIFSYRNNNGELKFSHVCSTVDMVEQSKCLDTNNIGTADWYRLDYIDLLVQAPSVAEDLAREVESDARHLYKQMQSHNYLLSNRLTVIGDATTAIAEKNTNLTVYTVTGTTDVSAVTIPTYMSSRLSTNANQGQNSVSVIYRHPTNNFTGFDPIRFIVDGVTHDIIVEVVEDTDG